MPGLLAVMNVQMHARIHLTRPILFSTLSGATKQEPYGTGLVCVSI